LRDPPAQLSADRQVAARWMSALGLEPKTPRLKSCCDRAGRHESLTRQARRPRTSTRVLDHFCDGDCPIVKDDLWLYSNRSHLDKAGAQYMISRSEDAFRRFLTGNGKENDNALKRRQPPRRACVGQNLFQKETVMTDPETPTRTPSLMTKLNPGDEAARGTPGTGEDICPQCDGSGRIDSGPCPNCSGRALG
jgi:hypothetical protein